MATIETTAVIRRLLDDDAIHEHIGTAGAAARDAYRRARRLPPEKAIQDKAMYDRMREIASGLSEATRRALGRPEPEPPPRRRGLQTLVLVTTGAVVVWASKARRRAQVAGGPSAAP